MKTRGSVIVYVLFMILTISLILFISLRSVKSLYVESASLPERYRFALEVKPLAMMGLKLYMTEFTLAKFRRRTDFNKLRRTYDIVLDDREYELIVEPEDGRISINLADRPTLERLFERVLKDLGYRFEKEDVEKLVDSLKDFIDKDSERRPYGAEDEYYTPLGYTARNSRLSSLAELMWVRGISEDVYREMLKYITVLNSPINVNYTTKDILILAGLSETEANILVSLQKSKGLNAISPAELYGAITPYHKEIYASRFVLHPTPSTLRVEILDKSINSRVILVVSIHSEIYDVLW